MEDGPRKLTCFDDKTNKRKKLEFLNKIWKTISNNTSGFGKDFIDSCSAFSNFKQDYLKVITGCKNCCSFEDYVEKDMEREDCKESTNQSRDQRISIYKTMSDGELKWNFFYKLQCIYKRTWDNVCTSKVFPCLSTQEQTKLKIKEEELWIGVEEQLRSWGWTLFSYNTTCTHLF